MIRLNDKQHIYVNFIAWNGEHKASSPLLYSFSTALSASIMGIIDADLRLELNVMNQSVSVENYNTSLLMQIRFQISILAYLW